VMVGRTLGSLVIDDDKSLNALRAYFRSVDDEWAVGYGIEWAVLETALDAEIDRTMTQHGEIRISTASGVLVGG
jgi:hypothetical protein